MEQLVNYIKPELLILIPVLYFIGVALKKSALKDKFIPLVLGLAGVLLCVLYVLAASAFDTWQSVLLGMFVALTQGILCAGASVYANQLYKQGKKEE